jgi:hypothetical protein
VTIKQKAGVGVRFDFGGDTVAVCVAAFALFGTSVVAQHIPAPGQAERHPAQTIHLDADHESPAAQGSLRCPQQHGHVPRVCPPLPIHHEHRR